MMAGLACSSEGAGRLANDTVTGMAQLEITQIPADVSCIRFTVKGVRTVVRQYGVEQGRSARFLLQNLPLGSDTFSADAYGGACGGVSDAAGPNWVSDIASAIVTLRGVAQVRLMMHRTGRGSVSVDFVDGGPDASDLPDAAGSGGSPGTGGSDTGGFGGTTAAGGTAGAGGAGGSTSSSPEHGICHPSSGVCFIYPLPFAEPGEWEGTSAGAGQAYASTGSDLFTFSDGRWTGGSGTAPPFSVQQLWAPSRGDLWALAQMFGPYAPELTQNSVTRWNGVAWVRVTPDITSPTPLCGGNVNAIWFEGIAGTSAADVWITSHHLPTGISGCTQALFHYDGLSWARFEIPERAEVSAIWAATSNDVWTVGASIWHWNGTAWTEAANPTNAILRAISGSSSTDVWAVGANGTIVHFDGSAWAVVASPDQHNLIDVYAGDRSHAWAVAASASMSGDGALLAWNGSGWTMSEVPDNRTAVAVWGSGANDVWLATSGAPNTPDPSSFQGNIAHWDGSSWSLISPSTPSVPVPNSTKIEYLAKDDVWAFSNSEPTIAHFDGARVTTDVLPDGKAYATYSDHYGRQIWAVLENALYLHDTNWEAKTPPKDPTAARIGPIAVDAPGHVFLAILDYASGAGQIYSGDGTTWTAISPTGDLSTSLAYGQPTSLRAVGPADFWLTTTDGFVHHYDHGAVASRHVLPNDDGRQYGYLNVESATHEKVWLTSAPYPFAYDYWGFHDFDGATLTKIPDLPYQDSTNRYVPLQFVGGDTVIAPGRYAVYQYSGSQWQVFAELPIRSASTVFQAPSGELWLTSASGLLYRPPGGAW